MLQIETNKILRFSDTVQTLNIEYVLLYQNTKISAFLSKAVQRDEAKTRARKLARLARDSSRSSVWFSLLLLTIPEIPYSVV